MDSKSSSSPGKVFKKHSTYCMKCLELLDIINLWEVGVDGAARNFIRVRRELACIVSGLQQLEELYTAYDKNSPTDEERDLLVALKNSAEKAMEISHNAASACFQKTKPHDDHVFQSLRGCSFSGPSSKPITRLLNSSQSQGAVPATDVRGPAKRLSSTKRPFSVMTVIDSPDDVFNSSSVEDSVDGVTFCGDHFKAETKSSISTEADYVKWTPNDPIEHKPEGWRNVAREPYHTNINSADEMRNRRSKIFNSHSVGLSEVTPSQVEDMTQSKSQATEDKSGQTERDHLSASPTFSDASDSDLQLERVMAKISKLEEERLNLMQTIEILQSDNVSVRQSLKETLGTLEMKDVQLKLAMHDLGIATSEIKRASELNGKLRTLER